MEKLKNTKLEEVGDILGNINREVQKELKINKLSVILPGTHDTHQLLGGLLPSPLHRLSRQLI